MTITTSQSNISSQPSLFSINISTMIMLWKRDIVRFFRQPTRLVGALLQPFIFWLVIGSGFASTFVLPGQSGNDQGSSYLQFFYPGVLMMIALFTSIFAAVALIEDRNNGFLQFILAGPAHYASIIGGKVMGTTTLCLIQTLLFLLLAPLAGFSFGAMNFIYIFLALFLASAALSTLGFLVAWWLNHSQAYHAVQMTLLLPLWIISGAMFPPGSSSSVMMTIMKYNPASYALSLLREGLYGTKALMPVSTQVGPGGLYNALFLIALTFFGIICCLMVMNKNSEMNH